MLVVSANLVVPPSFECTRLHSPREYRFIVLVVLIWLNPVLVVSVMSECGDFKTPTSRCSPSRKPSYMLEKRCVASPT